MVGLGCGGGSCLWWWRSASETAGRCSGCAPMVGAGGWVGVGGWGRRASSARRVAARWVCLSTSARGGDGGGGVVVGLGGGVVEFGLQLVELALVGVFGFLGNGGPSVFAAGRDGEARVGVDELVHLVGELLAGGAADASDEPAVVEGGVELVEAGGGGSFRGDGGLGHRQVGAGCGEVGDPGGEVGGLVVAFGGLGFVVFGHVGRRPDQLFAAGQFGL